MANHTVATRPANPIQRGDRHAGLESAIRRLVPFQLVGADAGGSEKAEKLGTGFISLESVARLWVEIVRTALAVLTAAALVLGCFGARAFADDLAEGRALYMRYCASCHGVVGNGRGPVARALTEQPGDLTKLGERFGTPLPAGQIARYIDGRHHVTAHGEHDMPVWGERFSEIWSAKGSRQGNMDNRIRKIVRFLDSIQKPSIPSELPRAPMSSIH